MNDYRLLACSGSASKHLAGTLLRCIDMVDEMNSVQALISRAERDVA